MKLSKTFFLFPVLILGLFPIRIHAQTFSDVTSKTFEYKAITSALNKGWITPQTPTSFGYGSPLTPDQWLYILMFLRTSDACPELGTTPNEYWVAANIRACLSGAGVPVATEQPNVVRRDEAMQQLFALRRHSFAFQQLASKPAGYVEPTDLGNVADNRQGALIAADRLKLIFRNKGKLFPSAPLLREDGVFSVWRFLTWERQGGNDQETNDILPVSKEAQLHHWRDLDTDIYVLEIKTGGDTTIRPILPRRSFNPATATSTKSVRDEFVYQSVSNLAQESGALAAINGSYFNVSWPWGALEDVAIVDRKSYLERTDRSTFVVCTNGKMFIGTFSSSTLQTANCTPQHALGAGPLFLSAGAILTQSTTEGFDEYTQWERRVGKNARTAIAVSRDRKTAYFIVVAGKSYPAFGRGGATLGTFLKDKYPDINDAMMFDGGGSSTLYANNHILVGMGVGGSTQERAVVSALGIFSKKADQAALTRFKKEQKLRWDAGIVSIKTNKPSTPFAWQDAKQVKQAGVSIGLNGTRGAHLQITDTEDHVQIFDMTFDLLAHDTSSKLTITRRQGTHEQGWRIPTEMHVINPKDHSDTDIIRLFAYMPESQKPDLKTFDVVAFRKTGIVFGDATGRTWFYYARDKQFSPAKFMGAPKPKTTTLKKKI